MPVASRLVGSSERELDIAAHGRSVLFEQNRSLLRAAFFQQHVGVGEIGVANQERVRKRLAEVGERRERLGVAAGFHVGVAEIIGHVVAQLTGTGLGAVQRINRFGIIVIERVSIANDKPCQRTRIFFGVASRVGFDSGVSSRSPILKKLLRHQAEVGRGYKGRARPADAR